MKDLINLKELHRYCSASIGELMADLGGEIYGDKGDQFAFKDNSSQILAVAHLDTVQKGNHMAVAKLKGETLVFNPKLDDRLGVYTILEVLPKLGVSTDVLLTENEERGRSTAAYFQTDKKYNWIVEFDRRGDDVVTYVYNWERVVGKFFETGMGSFSDISELEHLGCKAMNVGIGYHDEHSKRAYFVIEDYVTQIERFVGFYGKYRDKRFKHEPRGHWYSGGYGAFEEFFLKCDNCGNHFYDDETVGDAMGYLCPHCGEHVSFDNITTELENDPGEQDLMFEELGI
ncbi:hypothetical protein BVX94_02285 [bacterium B17]|nr:hypothetical protein BVX94_02285 [bacterium B17]